MYGYENDEKSQLDLQLNPYECAMLNNFKSCNVHAEIAEIEKWSILNTKLDYVEYNTKKIPSNRENFKPTKGGC